MLAHSAAGDLALLYAAGHPERVRTLTLITARTLGVDFTEEHRRETAALRSAEPWFAATRDSFEACLAGTATDADWDAIAPYFYGRWDAAAQAHAASDVAQSNEKAGEIYASPGAFEPPTTRAAIAALRARVLVMAGELDSGPRPRVANAIARLFPHAEVAVQPGVGHFPWLDDADHFAKTVGTFLTRSRD